MGFGRLLAMITCVVGALGVDRVNEPLSQISDPKGTIFVGLFVVHLSPRLTGAHRIKLAANLDVDPVFAPLNHPALLTDLVAEDGG